MEWSCFFFFSSRRRHTRCLSDWSSDVCSSDVNWRALGFTAAITLLTALLVGLAPALHASRAELFAVLKDGARGSSSGGGGRMRAALIVSEVVRSVVLVVGSSLLLLSFGQLHH